MFIVLLTTGFIYLYFDCLLTVWWYVLPKSCDAALYAFSVYDADRSDTMDTEETNQMLKDIYGKYYATSEHGKKLNRKIQRLGKNGLAREQFEKFAEENEELLEIPNKYLSQICSRTLGKERWLKLTETRQQMNQNQFMDLYDFLTILNSKTGSNIEFVTLAEHTENVSMALAEHSVYVCIYGHTMYSYCTNPIPICYRYFMTT